MTTATKTTDGLIAKLTEYFDPEFASDFDRDRGINIKVSKNAEGNASVMIDGAAAPLVFAIDDNGELLMFGPSGPFVANIGLHPYVTAIHWVNCVASAF